MKNITIQEQINKLIKKYKDKYNINIELEDVKYDAHYNEIEIKYIENDEKIIYNYFDCDTLEYVGGGEEYL